MSRWYIGTDTGSKALAHYAKGASAKDHKWVSRSLKNGHWVYKYPVTTTDLDSGKISQGKSKRGENTNDWLDEGIDSATGYKIEKSTKIQGGGSSVHLDEWKDETGREGFTISADFGQDLSGRYGFDNQGHPYTSMAWYKDDAPDEYKFWNTLAQGKDPIPRATSKFESLSGSGPASKDTAASKAKRAAEQNAREKAFISKSNPINNAAKTADNRKAAGSASRAGSSPTLERIKKETAERKTVADRRAVQKKIQNDARNKVNAANAQQRYAELMKKRRSK